MNCRMALIAMAEGEIVYNGLTQFKYNESGQMFQRVFQNLEFQPWKKCPQLIPGLEYEIFNPSKQKIKLHQYVTQMGILTDHFITEDMKHYFDGKKLCPTINYDQDKMHLFTKTSNFIEIFDNQA